MRRNRFVIVLLVMLGAWSVAAQNTVLQAGDPPVASLIRVSAPDANGAITISGAAGAVFPAAQVAVRNLYTDETAYAQAGITGTFTVQMNGGANTPFWISPAVSIPLAVRNDAGSLPGGPGTILYAPFPEADPTPEIPITRLTVDGDPADWEAYLNAEQTAPADGLRNLDSIYLLLQDVPDDYAAVRVELTVDGSRYEVTLDPRQNIPATWTELGSVVRELGTIGLASAAVGDIIELRFPLDAIIEQEPDRAVDEVQRTNVVYLDGEGEPVAINDTPASVNLVNETDGVFYTQSELNPAELVRFNIGGNVGNGAATWNARVRLAQLTYDPGDTLNAEIDVRLNVAEVSPALVGAAMIGRIGLQPVTMEDNFVTSAAAFADNGWSDRLTASGLAVNNLTHTILLGEVRVPPPAVVRRSDTLLFGMATELEIPNDLPPGLYVPVFEGFSQVGDGTPFRWGDAGLFGEGERPDLIPLTRMPVVLNIGRDPETPVRSLWTLFNATPSDGSLGLMAQEDVGRAALSNNVRFNSPTYILPFNGTVPLEPYLLNQLPNAYDFNTAPLIPLLFPNGRLTAVITKPDGDIDNIAGTPVVQNVLSSAALDERQVFGTAAPLDVYRLTTLNEAFTTPTLDHYGDYSVELTGFVEDVWGNRYEGGGTYSFVVAELLDLTPAALPGTPFNTGDTLNMGLRISPGIPADVTVSLQFYPLDGSAPVEREITGTAGAYGAFFPEETFTFDGPGEYVVDYDARYTDADGRLWAGSLRGAGVVSAAASALVTHGKRGITNPDALFDAAWFLSEQITSESSSDAAVYTPYHNGDVAFLTDTAASGVQPGYSVQDLLGRYALWLAETHPDLATTNGRSLSESIARDMLPAVMLGDNPVASNRLPLQPSLTVNDTYTYLSYVRPATTARQSVSGGTLAPGEWFWDMNDPQLGQIGAGAAGMQPGDYAFLFGGTVLRNPDANIADASIYGALAVTIDPDDPRGTRVFPPYHGAAGGPDGGPLRILDGESQVLFFHPTAATAGDVFYEGDRLSVAGQVAPPLASAVTLTITAPDGETRITEDRANSVGYFYDSSADVSLDQPGIWTVTVDVTADNVSSAGGPPTLPPTVTQSYNVYVVPEGNTRLTWDEGSDISVAPGFPFNFTFDVPPGWTDVTGYLTLAFPGSVAADGETPITGTGLRYQFNPTSINNRFPFYEGQNGRVAGPASSDPVTLTFVITGTNAAGRYDLLARQITLRHDRLITLD